MGRAERRRQARQDAKAKRPATYNFTLEELKANIKREVEAEYVRRGNEIRKEATEKSIQHAMILLYALPMMVLRDHYWKKTYRKKIPEFVGKMLELYSAWDSGDFDLDQAQAELWRYAGVKLGEGEGDYTEDVRIVTINIPEAGEYEVEIDTVFERGDRWTVIIDNPWGEGEALCYGFSESELKRNIAKQMNRWREEAQ